MEPQPRDRVALAARQGQSRRPRAAHDQHDFPLHIALRDALLRPDSWKSGWMPLYEGLANDFLYADPAALVVFAENHDTTRLLAHVDGDLGLWKPGMAWIATVRGIRQFYYGSEVLLRGPAERRDGELRADLPGGWPGDAASAFAGTGLTAAQREAQDLVRRLFTWRRSATPVHAGTLTHYAPVDGVYVYFREHAGRRVMVALNRNPTDTALALARFSASLGGGRRHRRTGRATPLRTDAAAARPRAADPGSGLSRRRLPAHAGRLTTPSHRCLHNAASRTGIRHG